MNFKKPKFSHEQHAEFFVTLKKRVNHYFQQNQFSTTGDQRMIFKTIFMFTLYLTPYFMILFGDFSSGWIYLTLWLIMGFGMAGIGLSIMHDANHGVYSKNKMLNNLMCYSMNLIGSNAFIWKIQHNVLHHSFTNIEGADQDIDISFVMRFSPHQEHRWFHNFQHYYAWILYSWMTLARVFISDFTRIKQYRAMNLVSQKQAKKELRISIMWKLSYFVYILILPILIHPEHWALFLLSFFMMHFICGFILALIFQTAHVMPSCEYPLMNEEGKIENSWAVHELLTTTNFSPKSRWFSWAIGGLNFQVEHHLFQNISHVHYRDISKIVRQTAEEFGLPYNSEGSFIKAVWNHAKMLRALGKGQMELVKA